MPGGGPYTTLQLTSPFGTNLLPYQKGMLHAIGLKAVERLSTPFELEIDAVSDRAEIDPDELLHQSVTLRVAYAEQTDRLFNGLVRRVVSTWSKQFGIWSYRIHVVPKLWFLGQSVDCRIFQKETADEILKTIFSENNIDPVEFNIFGDRPIRPYTTQYNETDLDFVHRIMQESGYYYFFRHTERHHKLVITDSNQGFPLQPDPKHRIVKLGDDRDIFDLWHQVQETAFGRVTLEDRDPKKPQHPVSGKEKAYRPSPGWRDRDVYRWPAMTIDSKVAADRARFRIESSEAAASLNDGRGFDPNLCAGFRFTLVDSSNEGFVSSEKDYVVHEVVHEILDDSWHSGGSAQLPRASFKCFPLSVQWRDELSIPRPTMAGVFSGIVLGNAGEEVHTDNLARIKVQPFYDHRKDTTADRSIFIRILHPWSGDRWGWQHLPRVGTEVGLAFMNGDPDNPVVAGCFYHEDNPPVFPVTDHQTRQGFRDRKPANLRGDGFSQLAFGDFNELSFEHKQGQEEIFINAQKDLNMSVVNNTTIIHRDGFVLIKSPIRISLDVGDGASRIVMTPDNISITSPTLTIRSGVTVVNFGEFTLTTADVTWTSGDFKLIAPVVTFVTPEGAFFGPIPIPAPE